MEYDNNPVIHPICSAAIACEPQDESLKMTTFPHKMFMTTDDGFEYRSARVYIGTTAMSRLIQTL